MLATMACSSKLVEPITMEGFELDADADAAGTASVVASRARAPRASGRVRRMWGYLLVRRTAVLAAKTQRSLQGWSGREILTYLITICKWGALQRRAGQ